MYLHLVHTVLRLGNPLACAVSIAALDVILDEDLPGRSHELGEYFKSELQKLITQLLEVRGRGLFIGVELHEMLDLSVKH